MKKIWIIIAGIALGYGWMQFAASRSEKPVSIWSPWIDYLSFAFGASLWWAPGRWAPFVGGLIVGVHTAQAVAER